MAKSFLDELVQVISVDADTRTYDLLEKKNKQVIRSTNMLGVSLKKVFGYLGAYFGTKALVNFADEWKNIDSILRLVTSDERQRLELQNNIFAITQRTRQEMVGTVDLYRRITVATEKLGTSEADRLKTTETINKALLIGGGSRASNMAALVQLGQGLAADALRGQELNSILEQSPRLAQAIADGLGLAVGDLRQYAEKNRGIRAKQVMDALLSQAAKIDSEFSNVNLTVGQSITMLNNSFGRLISGVDKANGLTDNLAGGIGNIAKILDKSVGLISVFVKYAKQLLMVFIAMRVIRFLSIPFDLLLLNLAEGVSLATAFKQVLLALNIKGLITASWLLLGPWIKLLAVALALKEIIDTMQGKDTLLRDASEALGNNYNNRMARDYEDIFNMFGDGWGGKTAAVVSTPALMIKNGTQLGVDKLLGKLSPSQTDNSKSIVNNITQNITTSEPQVAADMALRGLERYNIGG